MPEYFNERRELALASAVASHIDQIECLLASPLGAESFVNDMQDPNEALAQILCQAVTLKDDAVLGEAVRKTVKGLIEHEAVWLAHKTGPHDADYEFADQQLGRRAA